MSYAISRSKLANLLIKAGYNKAKSLRFVRYPYLESIQLVHNLTFHDNQTEDIRRYQNAKDEYVDADDDGFAHIDDREYEILGNKKRAKAFLRISQSRVNYWKSLNYAGVWWYSYPLKVVAKYRYKYPRDEVQDSYNQDSGYIFGVATSAGDYGEKSTAIPIPRGWLEIILPEVE